MEICLRALLTSVYTICTLWDMGYHDAACCNETVLLQHGELLVGQMFLLMTHQNQFFQVTTLLR